MFQLPQEVIMLHMTLFKGLATSDTTSDKLFSVVSNWLHIHWVLMQWLWIIWISLHDMSHYLPGQRSGSTVLV